MTAPSLRIRHWRNDFLVPHDCAAPERVRADLDDIAEGLPEELVAGLGPWFSTQAEKVVLVKSLAFDCELDLSRERELVSARWAYQFAKALIHAVESGGESVVHFSSPAAYHAQLIADLASGHDGSAWYYRPYAGLAALPSAGAIRTLLLEDPELGRETLTTLSPEVWNRLGAVLTRREALRILEGLSGSGGAEGTERDAVAALFREHAPQLPAAPWFVTALYLFSAALHAGFRPNPDLAGWVGLAAKLPTLATRSDAAALAEALQQGNLGVLVAADPERDAESWSALTVRPEWRTTLAEILQAETARAADTAIHTRGDAVCTAFGGLVLLLPELDGLLDEAVSGALPPTQQASARGLAAWLILAQCAGQARASQFVGEVFWRELFGIPPEIDRAELNLWLAGVDATPAAAWLAERTADLARGMCCPTPLRAGDQRWLISVDQASGVWFGVWSDLNSPQPDPLPAGEGKFDNSLSLGKGSGKGARVTSTQSPDSTPSTPWRARLAAARRARDDWRYLAMDWGLPDPWQRLFTHMAQIVLRRFAYRIPGFAGASMPYIFANFLAGSGTLDPESGRLQLARPPLHVLLNLTGIGRASVRWSGPPARDFQLDYES